MEILELATDILSTDKNENEGCYKVTDSGYCLDGDNNE